MKLTDIEKKLNPNQERLNTAIEEQATILQESFYEVANIGDSYDEYLDNANRLI